MSKWLAPDKVSSCVDSEGQVDRGGLLIMCNSGMRKKCQKLKYVIFFQNMKYGLTIEHFDANQCASTLQLQLDTLHGVCVKSTSGCYC